jgi:hypothetical protein
MVGAANSFIKISTTLLAMEAGVTYSKLQKDWIDLMRFFSPKMGQ